MRLESPLTEISGIGQLTADRFKTLGINNIEQLLSHWPRRYDDFSNLVNISAVQPGSISIKAKVENLKIRHVRRGLTIVEADLRDETGVLKATWFNQPYRMKYFDPGKWYYFSGSYDFSFNRYSLQNPAVEIASDKAKNTAGIIPVYTANKQVSSSQIRAATHQAIDISDQLVEDLPNDLIDKRGLMGLAEATNQIHFPDDMDKLKLAKDSIGYRELYHYILKANQKRSLRLKHSSAPINIGLNELKKLVASIPFKLTDDQRLATWEIIKDLKSEHQMMRLLDGDVGSGKTVVAALASAMTALDHKQVALMAPTEILAKQHYSTFTSILKDLNLNISTLSSSMSKVEQQNIKSRLQSGNIDIVIGTHSLIQDSVEFKDLALVVVDEQHRFGVKQRAKLLSKGGLTPHMLSMTATPIPRSLAMSVYADVDVSIIKTKPRTEVAVETKIVSPNSVDQTYSAIAKRLSNGQQAAVICPLVESGEDSYAKDVLNEAARLSKTPHFSNFKVAALHGKMKSDQKDQIMKDFYEHKIDLLVSTTVIEVGIDVPNLTSIVIEDADRFGLAQLHQLRGRVGRGQLDSYCYLVNSNSNAPSKRLRSMEHCYDGFKLAKIDLEIRGPGAISGSNQHGKPPFKLADITNLELIKQIRSDINTIS